MINITSHSDPKKPVSEAYRTIRTNIQFSKLDNDIKTIVVTSSKQNEGKSTVVCNLAVSFASLESKKVLIIDSDLRNPTIHRLFSMSNTFGLTDILTGEKDVHRCINKCEIDNLHVITTGRIPPNPSEVIASKKMEKLMDKLKEEYDYIFIDTPPIGVITDAGAIANYADGTILVVAANEVDIEMAKIAKNNLMQVDANIIGSILNKYQTEDDVYRCYEYTYENESKRSKQNKQKKKNKQTA